MSDSEGPAPRVAIGISFGNSYSSIAYTTREGKAEVIANEDGDRQIPSILSYVEGEEFQGAQAKSQLVRNPQNTVACFRDYLGQEFRSIDPTPCHHSAHPRESDSTVSFSICDNADGDAHDVTVSEITTRHLRRLKNSASDFLGKAVTAAVIAVPTNFSEAQKAALSSAAEAAGLEVLQCIHEPVAAVLAYDARADARLADKLTVVVDLGGIRSDVAVVANRGGIYSILATAHDYDVGGAQLDNVLVDHFAREFLKKHARAADKADPRESPRSLAKLRLEAEAVKKALSLGTSATFSVESLAAGLDFTCSVNRSRYELLASKLFAAMTRLVAHAVEKAGLDPLDVDEVVLAGGTAHTPRVATNLAAHFPGSTVVLAPATTPATALNPSELAARGAAIQASLVAEFDPDDIEQSTHPMVTATPHLSHAVGVLFQSADDSGSFRVAVQAETAVPVRRTVIANAPKAGGDVLIRICEGVREIRVSKPEAKPKTNGEKEKGSDNDSDEDDSEEEEEEMRDVVWKAGQTLAEAGIRGVKKGGKVEVQLSIGADLGMQVIAREVGAKGGVRGMLKSGVTENGSV